MIDTDDNTCTVYVLCNVKYIGYERGKHTMAKISYIAKTNNSALSTFFDSETKEEKEE